MVWFGLTFSYEQYAQTIARIDRQGQNHSVVIHNLIAENTIDEMMQETLSMKATGQFQLLDSLNRYAAKR